MLALAAESQRTPSPVFDQTAYIRPQRLVAIGGGRRLNLYCSGSGKPVVILEAGGPAGRCWIGTRSSERAAQPSRLRRW